MIVAFHLLIGWLIADLISGIVHWIEDRILWVGMPLISKSVVEPNRLHHEDPRFFLDQTIWQRGGTTWFATAALAGLWLWLIGFSFIWLSALAGGLLTAEIHAMAHRGNETTGFPRVLQQIGIIQSPSHHAGHHSRAMDTRYCTLTDFLNPLLDWIGVWPALEKILTTIGLEPNRGTQ
ncbi:fatty acid desaturase CarF family protein [Sphingorhabdus sp. 109]|uniref:fatty acid desaturase CarF family protein n=1 Tax=Sphingorhabdus sp. 109 TaxID=2653173 RepID=UPI0012F3946B|nr:fatty acid desaturase CarF family protein [Sphingorhabdus sp. 109]VWX62560.1 conserved hypothetical protein [Sphingorhabdus sp. 109]